MSSMGGSEGSTSEGEREGEIGVPIETPFRKLNMGTCDIDMDVGDTLEVRKKFRNAADLLGPVDIGEEIARSPQRLTFKYDISQI